MENFEKIKLKTYFMLKPVSGMTDQQAIDDIKHGIDYLDDLSQRHNIEINMHLNPTYVAKGTVLEKEFIEGTYTPPQLEGVRKAVIHAENKNISIFVGLNDEGLAVEGGSFIRSNKPEDIKLKELLEVFNSSQNYSLLK